MITVKIFLTKPKNLFTMSYFIRKVQKTDYSHYGIWLNGYVLEATASGVKFHKAENFLNHNTVVREYELMVDTYSDTLYTWAASIIGTKYGFVQLWGYLFVALKIFKRNPFGRNSKRLVCSEVVAIFMQKFFGAKIGDSDSYDLISTEKLVKEYYNVSEFRRR